MIPPYTRDFAGPVADVRPGERPTLPNGTRWVQCTEPLTDSQHDDLARWFAGHPDAGLRVYGYDHGFADTEFLRFHPDLRGFAIDVGGVVPDLTGLRHLPGTLRRLRVGVRGGGTEVEELLARCTDLEALSISVHGRLPSSITDLAGLRRLTVDGPVADIGVVSALIGLEELTLNGVTLPDLSSLSRLHRLRSLRLLLGGTRDSHPWVASRRCDTWRSCRYAASPTSIPSSPRRASSTCVSRRCATSWWCPTSPDCDACANSS